MSRMVHAVRCVIVASFTLFTGGCRNPYGTDQQEANSVNPGSTHSDLTIDPATGIPYAITFQHPIIGFDTSDYGFGFGSENVYFCEARNDAQQCTSYGFHLGRDTIPSKTPVGTDVFAPADGIVRLTTDVKFNGLGSDNKSNPNYLGCAVVLEHLLQNGQAVTTLLEHMQCESGTPYDANVHKGNPAVGTIVHRGQYVAHVAHYWHGSSTSIDWHHLHWGMRKGRFTSAAYTRDALAPYIQGYASRGEFTSDPVTGALVHPFWLDPFLMVAANGDPALQAAANVRAHPPGSLLQDTSGGYWTVKDSQNITSVPTDVMVTDRYDAATAIQVSDEEIGCYRHTSDVSGLGPVNLYVRPGTHAVVMAYDRLWQRFDVIRWEALLSWGFTDADIHARENPAYYEASYINLGFRLMRPGSLVKADEESEVAIVTPQQTRLPIASGDVFEQAGFRWERVVSFPKSVLDQVAGTREAHVLSLEDLRACAVPKACPGGNASCGGGGILGCSPGEQATCSCTNGDIGTQQCAGDGLSFLPCVCPSSSSGESGGGVPQSSGNRGDACGKDTDCNGDLLCEQFVCIDPSPATGSGGSPPVVGDPPASAGGSSGMPSPGGSPSVDPPVHMGGSGSAPASGAFHLLYQAPTAGPLTIQGWWQLPNGSAIAWGTIASCVDANPNDAILECDLSVPSGSSVFEFQVTLSGPRYWGDESCYASGGCGKTVGTLTLTKGGTSIVYTLVPNGSGPPYYNGHLAPVP